MILQFLNEHFVMLFELAGLIVLLGISVHIPSRVKRLTVCVSVLLIAQAILFKVEEWTSTFETLNLFRPMLTACIYSFYPIILMLALLITTNIRLSSRRALLLLIPEFICIPVYFTSQWTHAVCYFTADNHYMGGWFPSLPYVVFALYLVIFLLQNVMYLKSSEFENRVIVGYLVVAPFGGMLLYMLSDYSNDYSDIFASALVLYFLFIYIHMARIDPLTNLLTRQSYYRVINSNSERITAAVSVDMNELKYINDNFGHDDGDKALSTVAEVLLKHRGSNGTVYRVGGDEFIILYRNADEEHIKKYIDEMRAEMNKTDYVCAFGYAMRGADGIEAAVVAADTCMYEDKAELKRIAQETGQVIHFRD
ncbi:MAG: GGDEF domain-containing protein [Clostridia bacterium]|nr:GGDEF domain-containing protein [Clostridia bacterium]